MTRLFIWWYQAACGCEWFGCEWFRHGDPCWRPCPLHEHQAQARWC